MTAREKAEKWLSEPIDEQTKAEIRVLLENDHLLEDAFYRDLEFGTGGMRGIMGIGSNRVNRYTLGAATQGLSNYLLQAFSAPIKVAIAYDCRNNSRAFAQLVADVLSANGIDAYLFADLRPTPQLSFAVRYLGCQSGIVITASHNPPEYNGYKVYWADGAQIVAPHDKGIIAEVEKIQSFSDVRFEADSSRIHLVGREMDEAFLQASLAQRFEGERAQDFRVAYTSLHGTSITLMPELLQRAGYGNVDVVEEQRHPDGNFPTVQSPNPEERAALDMALRLAEANGADMVVGTDPDSDRLGVAVRDDQGEMVLLNGNQCGVLLTDYLLRKMQDRRTLTGQEFIAYTIVSSDLFRDVATHYGVQAELCLTGFKHIAALIRTNEGQRKFVGGGEESYGYMVGDFVRDKDALTSTLLFCDLAAEAKARGNTVMRELETLYQRHGFYLEHLISLTKKGKEGAMEITAMMDRFRTNPPRTLGGEQVVRIDDYQKGTSTDLRTGDIQTLTLPASNVLQFFTEGGSKVSARPSGTEPKIKFYFSVRSPWQDGASYAQHELAARQRIEEITRDLGV